MEETPRIQTDLTVKVHRELISPLVVAPTLVSILRSSAPGSSMPLAEKVISPLIRIFPLLLTT